MLGREHDGNIRAVTNRECADTITSTGSTAVVPSSSGPAVVPAMQAVLGTTMTSP
jgi:hypothetical protein